MTSGVHCLFPFPSSSYNASCDCPIAKLVLCFSFSTDALSVGTGGLRRSGPTRTSRSAGERDRMPVPVITAFGVLKRAAAKVAKDATLLDGFLHQFTVQYSTDHVIELLRR